MAKKAKRPTDINQRAKSIVDIATGETEDTTLTPDGKKAFKNVSTILSIHANDGKNFKRLDNGKYRVINE